MTNSLVACCVALTVGCSIVSDGQWGGGLEEIPLLGSFYSQRILISINLHKHVSDFTLAPVALASILDGSVGLDT